MNAGAVVLLLPWASNTLVPRRIPVRIDERDPTFSQSHSPAAKRASAGSWNTIDRSRKTPIERPPQPET